MRLIAPFKISRVVFPLLLAILILAYPVVAAVDLHLPDTLVNITVQNDTGSYFVTTLSNVPSGYDVANATYPGWCIDQSAEMTRNQTFEVMLYSSLNAPGNLSTERWDMVNYILNHKQGIANDTQRAIWYFVNLTSSYNGTLTPVAQSIVNDALANGTGFIPMSGQVMAVICYPEPILPPPGPVQDSIIEVPVPAQPLTLNVSVSGGAQLVGTNSYRMDSGGAATFNASVQGGTQPYYYTWYVDGVVNSTDQSLPFTTQQIGTYSIYVNVTDSGNPAQQTTSVTYSVTVQAVPPAFNVTVSVSGDAQLVGTNSYHMDSGASATFVANVQGGTQPYYYTWYVDGVVNSTDQSLPFTAAQIGTYSIYVNVTDSGNPAQQIFSDTCSVTVPEYSLLVIALLSVALIPVIVLVRKKRVKA